jgi:hypothetical protein
MELSKEVQSFSSACERLIDTIARHRQLTKDERRLIEHYSPTETTRPDNGDKIST